jgi:preprotein translocase subunit YajC
MNLLAQGLPGEQPANPLMSMLPMLVIIGVMVFFMISSSSRQRREQQNLLSNLKKGDEVLTSSGIYGIVINVKENEDELTLRSDEARLRVMKSTVIRVIKKSNSEV